MKHLLETPEIQSVDHLILILNTKNELLQEAHKLKTETPFDFLLTGFFVFRETMLERTEEFLENFVPAAPKLDGIRRRLEEAIMISMGICLSPTHPYTHESLRLSEEDAYKSRYLLAYLSFLKDLNTLISQYMEYSVGFATNPLNFDPEVPLLGGTAMQNPEVKGIAVNQSEELPEDFNLKEYKKNLNPDERKAYRLSIVYVILDEKKGWENFLKLLTNEGKDQLYAELTDSSQRYSAGIKNGEKRYAGEKYAPYARFFLNNLPRFKRKNL